MDSFTDNSWYNRLRLGDTTVTSGSIEGRVETRIQPDDDWSQVCDAAWDSRDAEAVCRTMGFE